MRASSILVALFALAIFSGCTERPHTGPQGNSSSGYFHVASFGTDQPAVTGKASAVSGLPKDVLMYLKMCLTDIAKNDAITQAHFEVSNAITGEIYSTSETDNKGCLHWTERVKFNIYGQESYLEQIRKVKGLDRYPGELTYRFAYNPWAVANNEGYPALVDLTLGQTLPGLHALVPAQSAANALQSTPSADSAKLYLDHLQVSVSENRFNDRGGKVTLAIAADPNIALKDVNNNPVELPIEHGNIKIAATLVAEVPTVDAKKNETYERVAISDPIEAINAEVLNPNHIRVTKDLMIPITANRGKVYVALMAYSDAIPVLPVKGQRLLQNEYDALCLISDSGRAIGQNCKLMSDSLGSTADQNHFNYQDYLDKVINTKEMVAKLKREELSDPYRPQVDGFTPVRYDISPANPPLYQQVGHQDPDRPLSDRDPMPQTNIDRWIQFTVVMCIQDHFTQNKVQFANYTVHKVNGLVKNVKADESGCITWTDDIHHNYYEIQHYFYREVRIQSADLGMDRKVLLAINPWERSGFIFSRDERPMSSCPDNKFFVLGIDPLGRDQHYCRTTPSGCKANEIPVFTGGEKGPLTCMAWDKVESYTLQARRQALMEDPMNKPMLYLDSIKFNIKQIDYDNFDNRLNMSITRRYMMQMAPTVSRHDSITDGWQGNEPLRDGYYYLRLVLQRNKKNEPNYIAERKQLEQTDCMNPANYKDPREDKGYLDSWEGVVELRKNLISLPMSFDFTQLAPLGARNLMLIELTPIDMRKSYVVKMQDPNLDIITIDQQRTRPVEVHDTDLITRTYRGFFVPLDDNGSLLVYRTCQSAEEVIAAGKAYEKKVEAAEKKSQSDQAAQLNPFVRDKTLLNLSLSQNANQIHSLVENINSSPAPSFVNNVKYDAGAEYTSTLPSVVDPDGVVRLGKIKFQPEDLANLVTYYYPRDGMPPEMKMSQDEYRARRYYFLRRLCYYWKSGKIYEDMFGKPNPFVAQPPWHILSSAFGNPNDQCAHPEQMLSVDKKIIIHKLGDQEDIDYVGAQAWNYNVAQDFSFSNRQSEDSSLSQSDTFAVKKFDLGARLPWGISLFNFSSSHDWKSSYATTVSHSMNTSASMNNAVYLSNQKLVFVIPVEQYQQCMIIKPYIPVSTTGQAANNFFTHALWKSTVTASEKEDDMNLGLMICADESNTPIKILEDYYFVIQHFNPSYALDPTLNVNRPWLIEIRGDTDYLKFRDQVENLGKKGFDYLKDSVRDRLPQNFLQQANLVNHRFPSYDGVYTIIDDYQNPVPVFTDLHKNNCTDDDFVIGILHQIDPTQLTEPLRRRSLGCQIK